MHCPVCSEKLRAIEHFGVALNLCPSCKGLWLDSGELKKLMKLECANAAEDSLASPEAEEVAVEHQRRDRFDGAQEHPVQRRRRGSWLANILEFSAAD